MPSGGPSSAGTPPPPHISTSWVRIWTWPKLTRARRAEAELPIGVAVQSSAVRVRLLDSPPKLASSPSAGPLPPPLLQSKSSRAGPSASSDVLRLRRDGVSLTTAAALSHTSAIARGLRGRSSWVCFFSNCEKSPCREHRRAHHSQKTAPWRHLLSSRPVKFVIGEAHAKCVRAGPRPCVAVTRQSENAVPNPDVVRSPTLYTVETIP